MSSPTIRIILDSFYQLILLLKNCHPESVVYRLPFAIKTILNLSGIVVCFVICARWWRKIWIHQLPPIIMNQVWSKWIKSLSDPGSSVINLSSYKFSLSEKRKAFSSNSRFSVSRTQTEFHLKNGPKPAINWKPITGQRITLKANVTSMKCIPEPKSHVTLISGYLFWQVSIDHNRNVQCQVKHSKCPPSE